MNLKKLKVSQKIQIKKTITWSIISFTLTTLIGWTVTGDIYLGLGIGILDRIFKMACYYSHERYWHRKYKEAKKALNK